jgi:hypothetical protein
LRALADCPIAEIGSCERGLPETKGIVLLIALFFLFPTLFFLFFAPVIRLFGARAFSSLFQWVLLQLARIRAL